MAFTKALYYPRIQVPDEGWLKTAMLHWEGVQTIVPASMPEPYVMALPACCSPAHGKC